MKLVNESSRKWLTCIFKVSESIVNGKGKSKSKMKVKMRVSKKGRGRKEGKEKANWWYVFKYKKLRGA